MAGNKILELIHERASLSGCTEVLLLSNAIKSLGKTYDLKKYQLLTYSLEQVPKILNNSIIVSVTVSLAHALVQFTSLALLNKTSGEVGSRYSQEQLRTG